MPASAMTEPVAPGPPGPPPPAAVPAIGSTLAAGGCLPPRRDRSPPVTDTPFSADHRTSAPAPAAATAGVETPGPATALLAPGRERADHGKPVTELDQRDRRDRADPELLGPEHAHASSPSSVAAGAGSGPGGRPVAV